MANSSLAAAREAKNGEFYTSLSDIQAEMNHYTDKFHDKVVFCNCDDPFESNFVKYFLMNFNRLGLKELIATGYKSSTIGGKEVGKSLVPYVLRVKETRKYLVGTQTDLDIRGAKYFLETEGTHVMSPLIGNTAHGDDGKPVTEQVRVEVTDDKGNPVLNKNGKVKTKILGREVYYEAGDFRSDMCISLLRESDIVVTNPPFSLFREYVAQLMQYQKQFLILGNMNAITYKEIFPYLRNNELWLGYKSLNQDMYFDVPDGYRRWLVENKKEGSAYKIVGGKVMGRLASACWFTNIDHEKRHIMLPLDLGCTYYGHEDMYPRYDNYDAINVDKIADIPCDYDGVMGVPITFLDKYCPEQFDIVAFRKGDDGNDLVFTREREREFNHTFESLYNEYRRGNQERRGENRWSSYLCAYHDKKENIEPVDLVYPLCSKRAAGTVNGLLDGEETYRRVLIKKKGGN